MISALRKAILSSNFVANGDQSYDGIFYASTSGTPRVERAERRRFERLCEVLGVEGLMASLEVPDTAPPERSRAEPSHPSRVHTLQSPCRASDATEIRVPEAEATSPDMTHVRSDNPLSSCL